MANEEKTLKLTDFEKIRAVHYQSLGYTAQKAVEMACLESGSFVGDTHIDFDYLREQVDRIVYLDKPSQVAVK